MSETAHIIQCPTCKQSVKWTPSNTNRPFCSERCRLIDLGAWAGEDHRIVGDSEPEFGEENYPE